MKGKQAIIGIISIILGLATSFILSPMYQSVLEKKADVVRVKTTITKGKQISENDLEVANVGTYNMSNKILKEKDEVLFKYAKTDIYSGSFITDDSISSVPLDKDTYLNNIPDNKMAISVTVHSFAAGLSSKLLKGDVVSVLVKEKEDEEEICTIPESLRYVEVLSSTEETGYDKEKNEQVKDEKEGNKKILTVTLLVNSEQASQLAINEGNAAVHLALVVRNDEQKKKALLEEQEHYFDIGKNTDNDTNVLSENNVVDSTDVNSAVNSINNKGEVGEAVDNIGKDNTNDN